MERFNFEQDNRGAEFQKNDSDVLHREERIMTGEITPKDRLQNQIRLAFDFCKIMHPEHVLHNVDATELTPKELRDERNKVMEYWGEEYSKLYREFENEISFKVHKRLQGDIFKITIEDIVHYKKTGELPED